MNIAEKLIDTKRLFIYITANDIILSNKCLLLNFVFVGLKKKLFGNYSKNEQIVLQSSKIFYLKAHFLFYLMVLKLCDIQK